MPSQPAALSAIPALRAARAESGRSPRPFVVRGFTKALVTARVWARVAWLAVRAYRSPIRGTSALMRLGAERWTTRAGARTQWWTSQKCVRSSGRYFWNLYAPGWPSVAFDRAVEHELARIEPLARQAPLQTAIIAITRRCALKCEHCLEWDVLNQPDALSSAELLAIVNRIKERGVAQVFFSGGEPLQRLRDVLTLSASMAQGTDVWILTSGLGLTADKARRLRTAGVTGVALSLDHWEASAHDRFRGFPGSFDAALRAADHAHEAGLVVALSLCPSRTFVTPANLDRYEETARAIGATFIQILEPKAIGHYAHQDVALESAQQRLLEAFAARLNVNTAAGPSVHYMDWSKRTFGCAGAGDRYIYIDSAGDMHACPFCREPGLRVLDNDIHTTLGMLQSAGCPAGATCARHEQ
jgi:MoaA/NifB/PqqE/SkfB family radical SAM enzyme